MTFLSILAKFSSTVIWTVLILYQISSPPHQISRFLGIVPNYDLHDFHLLQFFRSLAMSRYFRNFHASFIFTLGSAGMAKSTGWHIYFFFSTTTKSVQDWLICFYRLIPDYYYYYNNNNTWCIPKVLGRCIYQDRNKQWMKHYFILKSLDILYTYSSGFSIVQSTSEIPFSMWCKVAPLYFLKCPPILPCRWIFNLRNKKFHGTRSTEYRGCCTCTFLCSAKNI